MRRLDVVLDASSRVKQNRNLSSLKSDVVLGARNAKQFSLLQSFS